MFWLTLFAALGCGLNGGVFFAFSSFVMKGLARLPASQGIAAMNSINLVAVTPVFMSLLFGTGLACAVLAVSSMKAGAGYLLAGSVLYILGTIVVTMIFNVPRNNALAALDPNSAGAAAIWLRYVDSWTAWNHVRTLSSAVAAALLTLGLL